ncbi:MAG: C39 family peptidase [Candidatus Nanoarchaeia archaeon]
MKRLLIVLVLVFIVGCTVQKPMQLPPSPDEPPIAKAEETSVEVPVEAPEPKEAPEDFRELQQQPEVTPPYPIASQLDVPKINVLCDKNPCLDYLGAYAMAARYYDNGIDLVSVVGYGGMGSDVKMRSNKGIDNAVGHTGMIIATQNYGFAYDLGLALDGNPSSDKYSLRFHDHADKIDYFNNRDDALDRLRRAISAKDPVIVYLDVTELQSQFAEQSDFWKRWPGDKKGHFMVVTGYDADHVYLNDPNDYDGKDLKATNREFQLAWEATKFLPEKLGPLWMMKLKRSKDIRKNWEDVVEANNVAGKNAIDQLQEFAAKGMKTDESCAQLSALAKTRELYSSFLERYEYSLASSMYDDSADFLRYACEEGIQENVKKASYKEENAQNAI